MPELDNESSSGRPNIRALFETGSVSLRSSKFKLAAGALSWRQKYLNAETYPVQLNNSCIIRLGQIKNGEMSGVGTGCSVWPAAHVLVKYMERRFGYESLKGKRVCDIGSGTGCTGIAAACLGATVTLTDQTCIFPLLKSNVETVIADCAIEREKLIVAEYNWGEDVKHLEAPFDIVIVSDCVLPKLYPIEPLVQAVSAVMSPTSMALFSYEHRPFPDYDPRQEFRRIAQTFGLTTRTIPLNEHDDVYSMDDIEIWEVRRIISSDDTDASWEQQFSAENVLRMISWGDTKPRVQARLFETITLEIRQACEGTIGCILWPSSVVLSRYLLKSRFACNIGEAKPLLAIDLGAGCGLTSIALCLCGYTTIAVDKSTVTGILSDNLSSAQSRISEIIRSGNSFLQGKAFGLSETLELDWYSPSASADILHLLQGRIPDLIVCSDCLYQSTTVGPLKILLSQVSGVGTELLIANELRSAFDEFLMSMNGTWAMQEIYLSSDNLEICSGDADIAGDVSFSRFERPVKLISAKSNVV